jgi:hypothetical protein
VINAGNMRFKPVLIVLVIWISRGTEYDFLVKDLSEPGP